MKYDIARNTLAYLIAVNGLLSFSVLANAPPEKTMRPENPPALITADMALKAIQLFEQNPTSDKIIGVIGVITSFAKKSDKVTVTLDQRFFPWTYGEIEKHKDEKYVRKLALLMGAFIAGNIKPQIHKNEKKDHPFEGLKTMLKAYKA
jgi:hypothetical protein